MKVLYLNNYHYLRGGSERVFFAEMELMKGKGHEAIGFARRHDLDLPSNYSEYFPQDFKTDKVSASWSAIKGVKEVIYSSEARRKLRMLVRQIRPDIVHAHNIYGRLTTSVLDCLLEEGVPVVMTLHDYKLACPTYNFTYRHHICEDCKVHRYYRAVLKRCHKGSYAASVVYAMESYFNWLSGKYKNKVGLFIAPSLFLKNKLVEYGWPKEKIRYIPNFIDHAQYLPDYTSGDFFLYLGRLSEEKGVRILIEAFKRIKNPGAGLVVAGDGPLREALEGISGSDSRIKFAGYVSGPDLQDLTRRALAVVLPSVCYENAPISLLEAMAYGKPVIGAAVGGIPEMIVEGKNGFLFAPGDVGELAGKMESLLNLPETSLAAMGKNARKKAVNDFNQDSHYENIMCVYNDLLHR